MNEIVDCDVVFPAVHGAGAEDGTLQAELEKHHARYVGTGAEASSLCFDKWRYREFVEAYDLSMAQGALVQAANYASHPLTKAPYVLKPINGGSAIDTYIVRRPDLAPHAEIQEAFYRHPTMILERLIIGIELTVGILGNEALPVIEIIPPAGKEFDYENKYNGASQELCPAVHVSQAVLQQAQAIALKAHQLTDCRDLSRSDKLVEFAQNR
jgi:D-alanine-D-alanine ligase